MKRKFLLVAGLSFAMACTLGTVVSCQGNNVEEHNDDKEESKIDLKLNETSLELNIGGTFALKATTNDDSAYIFGWESSDTSVASVKFGNVTGLKEGKATITVSVKKKGTTKVLETAKCEVNVVDKSITLDKTELKISLSDSETAQLTATLKGLTGDIEWTSSNPDVATVDNKGLVKGLKTGETVITAKVDAFSAKCNVEVFGNYFELKGVEVFEINDEKTLEVTGKLSDDAVWSTSNSAIVSVKNGVVTCHKLGMATITVKSAKDNITSNCVVVVKNNTKEEVTELKAGKKSDSVKDPKNYYYLSEPQAEINVIPTYDNGLIRYNVAKVGTSGSAFCYLRYQPDNVGNISYKETLYIYSATPTKLALNGGADIEYEAGLNVVELDYTSRSPEDENPTQIKFKAAADYYIIPMFEEVEAADKLTLDECSKTLNLNDEANKSFTLKATVPGNQKPTWTSSDDKVATVKDGVVTAVSKGQVYITATSGEFNSSCIVTVIDGKEVGEDALIPQGVKSETIANAGNWYHIYDKPTTGPNPTYNATTNEITADVTFVGKDDAGKNKYGYIRFQPKELGNYKARVAIKFSKAEKGLVYLSGGVSTSLPFDLVEGNNYAELEFKANESTPFQIKIASAGMLKITVLFEKIA